MQESKVINLFEGRDNDKKLMTIEDFPKEVRRMWAIVEYKETDRGICLWYRNRSAESGSKNITQGLISIWN